LCIAQGIEQYKEDQRYQQDVENAQPIQALKYKEDVIKKIRHS
jgi:hypothetical protein